MWPFFVSYYFISSIVLFNVIVAILLDEFILAASADKFSRRSHDSHIDKPLDPVLAVLSTFAMPSELDRSIHLLFRLFDKEDAGRIGFLHLQEGLDRLRDEEDASIELSVGMHSCLFLSFPSLSLSLFLSLSLSLSLSVSVSVSISIRDPCSNFYECLYNCRKTRMNWSMHAGGGLGGNHRAGRSVQRRPYDCGPIWRNDSQV